MPVATTFKDYYGILLIQKTATDDDIKAAYKNLVSIRFLRCQLCAQCIYQALQWHPDRHTTQKEEAGRRFIEVNRTFARL